MTAQKYYKRGVVKAEQFDGSEEMAEKYGLNDFGGRFEIPAPDEITYGEPVQIGDYLIYEGGELQAYSEQEFFAEYQPLPVISQAVAYAIEWFQQNDETIGEIWRNAYEDMVDDWEQVPQLREAEEWMLANQDAFALAWLMDDREEEETHAEANS